MINLETEPRGAPERPIRGRSKKVLEPQPLHPGTRSLLAPRRARGNHEAMRVCVRIRMSGKRAAPAAQARRAFIFQHRSFRSLPVTRQRMAAAGLLACLFTLTLMRLAPKVIVFHENLCGWFLDAFQIPIAGWTSVQVSGVGLPAKAPEIPIPPFHAVSGGPRLFLILAVVALMLLARRFGLTRNFAGFLVILLCASAFVCAADPGFMISSAALTRVWLQIETLTWLLLPWLGALIFVMLQPDLRWGALWMLAVQIYAAPFSAFRLAFILAAMHHTGMLFFPALWFALGLLGTLIYVLFFYSVSVYVSTGRLWGARGEWRQ